MVVDEGSFAAAARKVGRATSVVSYSIAKLEAQLGASLFKTGQHQKAAVDGGRPDGALQDADDHHRRR